MTLVFTIPPNPHVSCIHKCFLLYTDDGRKKYQASNGVRVLSARLFLSSCLLILTYGKGNRTRVRSKNSWRTTTRLFGAGMWRTRAGLRAVLVGVCIGIVRCNASITKCPGPGEQDASWFPGDVVDCAGPCITKIVPTGEAAAPIGDGGAVSKLAMQDECGDIVAQGGAISSVCAVKFTGHFHMPPGMQEADDVFFATDAFSSSFNERIKLWVDNSLLIIESDLQPILV